MKGSLCIVVSAGACQYGGFTGSNMLGSGAKSYAVQWKHSFSFCYMKEWWQFAGMP